MGDEKKAIANFKYWIDTNTERGVCYLPDYICTKVLNIIEELQKENEELKISNKEIDKECSRLEKKEVELEKEKLNTIELINKLKLESRITELDNVIIQAIDELKNVNFYEPRLRNKNQKEVNKAYSILFDALKTKES